MFGLEIQTSTGVEHNWATISQNGLEIPIENGSGVKVELKGDQESLLNPLKVDLKVDSFYPSKVD